MKNILFGALDADMKTVLDNIPYNIDYIITNTASASVFHDKNVYTSIKLFSETDPVYIYITDPNHYEEYAEQLMIMGFSEGKDFSGAREYIYNQWENIEYFDDIFTVRIQDMTKFISADTNSIMDLGCGPQRLKQFLNHNVEYYGVDYTVRGDNTIVCDFNQKQFPVEKADTLFCSGCLEYIENYEWFIQQMCRNANQDIIISYCPLEYKHDISERSRYGWKNYLTINQLKNLFAKYGFVITHGKKSIGSNVIFRFQNTWGAVINEIIQSNLTYLEIDALKDLMETVYMTNELDGCMIETGCALGGSGICIASVKADPKPLFIYDVFDMIPEPGEKDDKDVLDRYRIIKEGKSQGIGGDLYYGYQKDLIQVVNNNFCNKLNITNPEEKNIHLIKGLFQDTLICNTPVAFAHIDCDWYDSVRICLERIVPNLVIGGIIIIDDYYHWSGARDAVDDYFKNKKEFFLFEKKSRLHIKKVTDYPIEG